MKNKQDTQENRVNSFTEKGQTPRIAFLVVYVFDDNTRPLFDIHLQRLRQHTSLDFRIFAAAGKLSHEHREYVSANPEIEIIDCQVPAEYSVRAEHSHCLMKLAESAMSRNFTHCMCLHLDSFPIADRWIEILLGKLDDDAKLAVILPNGYSAGLLFSREYYDRYRPTMLVSEEERETDTFTNFTRTFPSIDHVETGLGYLYRAWSEDVPWIAIETDNNRKIYGGLLFHMVGATYRTWSDVAPIRQEPIYAVTWQLLKPFVRQLPTRQRHGITNLFVDRDKMTRDGSVRSKKEEITDLISNPDLYLDRQLANFQGTLLV